MKVEFLVENLISYLPLLTKVIASHAQLPVLSNFLLKAHANGLTISATDLEIGVSVTIPAKVSEEGAVTIPGRQFAEVVNSLPKDKVALTKTKDLVAIESRDNHFEFQTIEANEFPDLYVDKGEKLASFASSELKKIFSKLIFAVSPDDARPALTGIYIVQNEAKTEFVATDGFRLSLVSIDGKKITDEGGFIISSRLISEALTIKAREKFNFYVHNESNQVLLETSEVVLVGRLIEGEFPPYGRVIPTESKTTITLDREEFHQVVKLAAVFARESANIVKLQVAKGMLSLSSKSSGVGSGDAKMNVSQTGEDTEVSFNVKYIIDVLRNLDGKELTIGMNSNLDPVVFKTPDDPNFLHVIMPVRVTD